MPDEAASNSRRASSQRRQTGAHGEDFAAGWLERRGYAILARNWRRPCGELDLIVERDGEIIGIEVKTRRAETMGAPEEAVTPAKRRKLVMTLQTYLMEREAEQAPYRIDVVAIRLGPGGAVASVRHYVSAVTLEE